jgi:hypothetical protein
VGKGVLGPEVSDLQVGLERDGAGDDLPEDHLETAFREVPLAQRCHAVEDGALAGRGVSFEALLLFDLANAPRHPRPPVQKTHDLLVHGVYASPERAHLVGCTLPPAF